MAPIESSSITVSRRCLLAFARRDAARNVVWLRGEHDVSTVGALSETLGRAIARDDADLVVDLSEVEFMGAATVGVIIRARELLRLRSRSLALRSPPRCARRILDLCGHAYLLDRRAVDTTPTAGTAGGLGMWPVPVARIIAAEVSSVDVRHRAAERTRNVAGRGAP
jgi:anti-anti-sigma factor